METTYEALMKNPNVVVIRTEILIADMIKEFGNASGLYREFAHSLQSVGRIPNRIFSRKTVEGGFYIDFLKGNKAIIFFILILRNEKKSESVKLNLKLRFGKLVGIKNVEVLDLAEVKSEELVSLLSSVGGEELMQPIMETYKKGYGG